MGEISRVNQLVAAITTTAHDRHKLILVVGSFGAGKVNPVSTPSNASPASGQPSWLCPPARRQLRRIPNQRLKQVMALGDRVKGNRQDSAAIAQLVAALGDSDDSIRWLAGSSLARLGGTAVVQMLAAFLRSQPGETAVQEARRVLELIAETDEDETVRQTAQETAHL